MTEKDIIDYIENIPRFGIKHTLAEVRDALHFLGDPDRAYPSIHVAGTNGKGSVCAFCSSILTVAGKKTGLFTSPHLVSMRERFRIDGEMISERRFSEIFDGVREADARLFAKTHTHLSYFEFLYLMACLYFKEEAVEVALIETGLGGRLDATNTLEQPLLCIITSISCDHMQYLGNDIASIAKEKAGIIKNAVPVVCVGKRGEALCEIKRRAADVASPVYVLAEGELDYQLDEAGGIDFYLRARYDELSAEGSYHLPFMAPYQAENAGLAVYAIWLLRQMNAFSGIGEAHIKKGLSQTVWEARMEEILPGVYLDGAHNTDAIDRLSDACAAAAWEKQVLVLFAASKDKACREMTKTLVDKMQPSAVIATSYAGERAVEAQALAAMFAEAGCGDVTAVPDPKEAFFTALKKKEDRKLIICGSLYLAGTIKEILYD